MLGNSVHAQSTAQTYASATIVNPIGTEKLSDFNYTSLQKREGSVVLALTEVKQNTSSDAKQAGTTAAFRISGEAYSFAILLDTNAINIKKHAGGESILADSFVAAIHKIELETIVSVGATLYFGKTQSPGFYSEKSKLNVLVNFE